MPIEIIAFACVHKCGSKVQTKRKRIEEHEKRCCMNPARRTCKTCAHDVRGGEEGIYCAIEKKPDSVLDESTMTMIPCVLRYDCPHWKSRAPAPGGPTT